ncbi:MAG TPA: AMP-binding protein [Burkholderiales bacterium]
MKGLALIGPRGALTAGQVAGEMEQVRQMYERMRPRVLALDMDNSPAWAIADFAALDSAIPVVPLPRFFTPAQRRHALRDSGADWILSDRHDATEHPSSHSAHHESIEIAGHELRATCIVSTPRALPPGTAKITYTSGTTGEPKGVCLSARAMEMVASSLVAACELHRDDVHLCALPLATLLENIGGLYAQRLAGARTVVLPSERIGLRGMEAFDGGALLEAMRRYRVTTAILVPQMLVGLVEALEEGNAPISSLRFIAVGGAPLSVALLRRARACGLPVYEGYGLTECASVVALNTPRADRDGSVGRVLPHATVEIARDGELRVAGATALGYVGDREGTAEVWLTGDLGYIDDAGFVHLTGRRRNMLVTAFGRNVAPEWVERELTAQRAIAQAAVFGEGKPWLSAVIVPRDPQHLAAAIAAANRALPHYAQVRHWIAADAAFSAGNGEATSNGRLRREALLARYGDRIDQLYKMENA